LAEVGPAAIAGAQTGWWLDDAVPGARIAHPHGRTIDEAEHVWLAWVTHNLSDVHGDRHAAARGPFGDVLVLGALTAAIVIGLAEPATPDAALAGVTGVPGWAAIRLSGPVRSGDTIRAESWIGSVTPGPVTGVGLVSRSIRGIDQTGRVVVVVEELDRPVARRPPHA